MQKVKVKRDCTYNDKLLKVGTTVYISEPYNFGKQKIFDELGELLAFCEIEWNDFDWNPVFVSPSEDKTAEPDPLYIFIQKTKDFYVFGEKVNHNDLREYQQAVRKAMTEYATLCRNKAIEEAVEVADSYFKLLNNDTAYLRNTSSRLTLQNLISELNKLKA